MTTLFNDSDVFVKERPIKLTAHQEEKFYLDMAKELIKDNYSDDDEVTIARDLRYLSLSENGYELAKTLEDYGNANYEIDPSFCEWLECLSSEKDDRIRVNIKAWVKAHDIKPKYTQGVKVRIPTEWSRSFKEGDEVYITTINQELAYYCVDADPKKKGGVVLAYEVLEAKCEFLHKG